MWEMRAIEAVLVLQSLVLGGSRWWDAGWDWRVPIEVDFTGLPAGLPVAVDDFINFGAFGKDAIDRNSLRLVSKDGEIELETSNWADRDQFIKGFDECRICFITDSIGKKKIFYLYFDFGKGKPPPDQLPLLKWRQRNDGIRVSTDYYSVLFDAGKRFELRGEGFSCLNGHRLFSETGKVALPFALKVLRSGPLSLVLERSAEFRGIRVKEVYTFYADCPYFIVSAQGRIGENLIKRRVFPRIDGSVAVKPVGGAFLVEGRSGVVGIVPLRRDCGFSVTKDGSFVEESQWLADYEVEYAMVFVKGETELLRYEKLLGNLPSSTTGRVNFVGLPEKKPAIEELELGIE